MTNSETYLAIARAALSAAQTDQERRTRRIENSVVVQYDPEQASFKQSLVAIVFAGVYLEALLYLEGTRRLGANYNDQATYESKVTALGIDDESIINGCRRLREVRRGIVHEKAGKLSDVGEFVPAQQEAATALGLVERITELLRASSDNGA